MEFSNVSGKIFRKSSSHLKLDKKFKLLLNFGPDCAVLGWKISAFLSENSALNTNLSQPYHKGNFKILSFEMNLALI